MDNILFQYFTAITNESAIVFDINEGYVMENAEGQTIYGLIFDRTEEYWTVMMDGDGVVFDSIDDFANGIIVYEKEAVFEINSDMLKELI